MADAESLCDFLGSVVSAMLKPFVGATLSLYADLQQLHDRSDSEIWTSSRWLEGRLSDLSLSSLGWERKRSAVNVVQDTCAGSRI